MSPEQMVANASEKWNTGDTEDLKLPSWYRSSRPHLTLFHLLWLQVMQHRLQAYLLAATSWANTSGPVSESGNQD